MKIERIVVGPLQVNCYIVHDERSRRAMIVDPGDDAQKIMKIIEAKKLSVVYLVCTHGHFDHIGAVNEIKAQTSAEVVLCRSDYEIYSHAVDQGAAWGFAVSKQPEPDKYVSEGDKLTAGDAVFEVLSTPGHSPGGICLLGQGVLLTGDTVFAGSVGRTDFYGGDILALKKSFARIMTLPPETVVLPGHGDETTVGIERTYNFFSREI